MNNKIVDRKVVDTFDWLLDNLRSNKLTFSQAERNVTKDEQRMQVNQVTFAILIGVLTVADMILIWTLGYIIIHYEKHGKILLRQAKHLLKNTTLSRSKERKAKETTESPTNN